MSGAFLARARALVRPPLVLLVLLVVLVLGTVRRYGVTWDEESGRSYSYELRGFYLTLGHDRHALTDEYMRFYGGFYEICAAVGESVLPLGPYESRHLVVAIFGVVGIVFAYRLGRLLGGRNAGLAAAVSVALTPMYYGHMFNNPKDIPFAATYLAAVYFIVAVRRSLPEVPWSLVVKTSLAVGLTLAIRVGGLMLFGLRGGAVVLAYAARAWGRRGATGLRPLLRLLPIPFLSWLVMCAFWPYALVSPLKHPLEALQTFSKYSWSGTMLFAGRMVSSHDLPRSYVPTWLAVTVPDFLIFALVIVALGALLRRPRRLWRLAEPDWLILLAASVGPTALVIAQRTVIYDGIRHLLFAVPPLVVLVAAATWGLLEEARGTRLRWAIALPVGWGMVLAAADMVSLHPYQSVYFNRLVAGGLPGAAGRFETDYWGSSLKEAVEWVMRSVPPPAGGALRVGNPNATFLTGYYVERNPKAAGRFVNVEAPVAERGDVDVYLSTTRGGSDARFAGKPVIHRVERQGVTLAVAVAVMSGPQLPPVELLPPSARGPSDGRSWAYMVPQAAHVLGYGGAVWRTDLVLRNPQPHPLAVTAQFLPTGKENRRAPTVATVLQPGQVLQVADVLTLPRLKAAGNFGALLVYASGGAGACAGGACDFQVLSRTFNAVIHPDQFRPGEWMGGVGPAAALRPGDAVVFSHVTRTDRSKASVGLASWSDVPTPVTYRVLDAAGREVERHEVLVPRFGHTHVALESEVVDGRVEVAVGGRDGTAMVVPYVSTVDGRTGLPTHVLPDAMPDHAPQGWAPRFPEAADPSPGRR